jgi:hypothetical protein
VLDTRGYLLVLAEELVEAMVGTHAYKEMDPPNGTCALRRAMNDLFAIELEDLEAIPSEMPTGEIAGTALRQGGRAARGEGEDPGPRCLDPPPCRTRHHAADRRRPVEGSPTASII